MNRTIAAAVLVLLMFGAPVLAFDLPWSSEPEVPSPGPPRPVVTEIVSDSDMKTRSVPGVVSAQHQVTLGFQTLGRLVERHVDLGDNVRLGDVLAALDPNDLEDNVRAASAAVDAAQVQFSTAEATAQRTRALARRNVASTAQLEQAEQALASSRAALEQAQSELIRAQDAEGFAQMTAPFDGVISAVYANPGAVLTAGEPVVQLSAQDRREAVIDLPEAALSEIDESAVFTVWQDSDQATETRATVDRIEAMADTATRTRRVYLRLDDGNNLRLGALIRARLAGETEIAMTLPDKAVYQENGQHFVWRVNRQGDQATVAKTPVQIGAALLGRIFVNNGLTQGDEVVIRGVHSLADGQNVGRSIKP